MVRSSDHTKIPKIGDFYFYLVVKTRLAATHEGGALDMVRGMIKNEGMIRPFYKGVTPMLLSAIPNNGITLGLFSAMKTCAYTSLEDLIDSSECSSLNICRYGGKLRRRRN